MFHIFKNKIIIFLVLLVIFGAFLRFFNLNWGSPYFFHPDERNIASSITRIQFPNTMNPHFFAYGSLPIYAIYFSSLPFVPKSFCQSTSLFCHIPFEYAIIVGRFFSAFLSLLLIPLMFLIGKKMHSVHAGIISAIFATFSTGFLQFAHFATFEMWTTFFTLLLFFFCLRIISSYSLKNALAASIICGILLSIKISNLLFLPLPLIAFILPLFLKKIENRKKIFLQFLQFFFCLLTVVLFIFMITNPFTFLDFSAFKAAISYESQVALGTLPVFYTGEFFYTIPILFQLEKVYPFLINPIFTMLIIPSLLYLCFFAWKTKSIKISLLFVFFLLTFIPQAFLFAKWTRYMMPTLPFLYLIIAISLSAIISFPQKKNNMIGKIILVFLLFSNGIFGISYVITAFIHTDSRVRASIAATKLIAKNSPILSEVYDMGIVAFNEHFSSIILYNFYELDNNSQEITEQSLMQTLQHYDYLILPSQRLLATRIINRQKFPHGFQFYKQLKDNKKMFTKLYQTPCDIFCNIAYLGDPIFRFEGTANSFDNPPLQIYAITHEK